MSDPKPTSVRSGMSGFTLIELMISLTIGALVLAAATGLMVTAAEARNSVKHTTELQEEAFFISHVLKQQLAQIGFRNIGPLSGITRAMPIASKNTAYPCLLYTSHNQRLPECTPCHHTHAAGITGQYR